MAKIGFIGCGNMGGALAKAAAKSDAQILLSDCNKEKLITLANEIDANKSTNHEIASICDYIFLGVKPQMMCDTLNEIKEELSSRSDRFVLVSMAAGLETQKIKELAGGNYPVIRIMPNTPCSVESGMILYTIDGVNENEEQIFLKVMSHSGTFDKITESLIDAGSAVSGCGPAFVCQFVEALADGGVAAGLPRDKALLYAATTLEGTARLILKSGEHPEVLKDRVCSPGGSTIEGVRRLEKGAFRGDVIDAVIAAYNRTKELGK